VLVWIKEHKDKPFYIYIHLMDTHSPYDTYWYTLFNDKIYHEQDNRGQLANIYDGRILYVDQQVQRLWEALKACQLIDDTMLVVTADHGEEIYEHGGTGHCTTLYEETIRVPLILHVPGRSQQTATIKQQTSSLAIPATILDFLELVPTEHMLGKSILPLADTADSSVTPVYTLSSTTRGRKSLRTEEGRKLFFEERKWDQKIFLKTIRFNNEWKLIIGDDGRRQLFNLQDDPMELNAKDDVTHPMFNLLQKKLSEMSKQLRKFTPQKSRKAFT